MPSSARFPLSILLGLTLLLLPLGGCSKHFDSGLPVVEITVGGSTVKAEVASTPESRATGLMFRRKMCRDCGMIFVFPDSAPRSFWMKNTYLPLSIAFLDAQGVVLNIEDMQPETETGHPSEGPAQYALEMNQGWFAGAGVKKGDRVGRLPQAAAR